MAISILHRITGNAMAFAGLALLLWWLGALASGPDAYATFQHWVWSPEDGNTVQAVTSVIGKIAFVGLTWAFFQHLLSGVRHFVLDIGAGYELNANALWSILTVAGSVLLTAGFWAILLYR